MTPLLEISLRAVQANWSHLRSITSPKASIAAVLKSNAYGLGLTEVAAALRDVGCSHFIVGNVDEGVKLRGVHPSAAIFILYASIRRDLSELVRYRLVPSLNDPDDLLLWCKTTPETPGFIRIDTGLSTLGIDWRHFPALWERRRSGAVNIAGAFSQLIDPSAGGLDTSELQRERFLSAARGLGGGIVSLAPSGAIFYGERFHLDMVRSGSFILGFSEGERERAVSSAPFRVSAPLIAVRAIAPGDAVGYDATFKADREMRVGIVGIGYAHGLPWTPASQMHVYVGGQLCPTIAEMAMEYTMVDLSEVPDRELQLGMRVVLIDGHRRTVEQLASSCQCLAHELIGRFGRSMPVSYVRA